MPENNYNAIVNQSEITPKLLALIAVNPSYNLTQINGQRIFKISPDAWGVGAEPSRRCEVFIGRIPHDCFEDVLVPLFQQVGELYEFRLMINFSGWNRGYAFAMYMTEESAANAVVTFNNYMVRPSWCLGVCPSVNNCRIFISRIPTETPSEEIVRLLYALTDEVQEVRIKKILPSSSAIVEYKSHRGAAMARKMLVSAAAAVWGEGARPAVDWSMPLTPQLLRQYREVGHMIEGRIVMGRASDSAGVFGLEPWSQARRMRMIRDAEIRSQRRKAYEVNPTWTGSSPPPVYHEHYGAHGGLDVNNNPITNPITYIHDYVTNQRGYTTPASGMYIHNQYHGHYMANDVGGINAAFANINLGGTGQSPREENQSAPEQQTHKSFDPWGLKLDLLKRQ